MNTSSSLIISYRACVLLLEEPLVFLLVFRQVVSKKCGMACAVCNATKCRQLQRSDEEQRKAGCVSAIY